MKYGNFWPNSKNIWDIIVTSYCFQLCHICILGCKTMSVSGLQSFTFEASDRPRSLLLAQINNLRSDLSLASIAKITRCLQVFISARSFLSIRFTKKVYPLYNAVFGSNIQSSHYYLSPGVVIAARCTKIARTPSKTRCAGRTVYKKMMK